MTIEELNIIIKANVTDAMKNIQAITNEVKSCVKSSIAPVQEAKQQIKQVAKESGKNFSEMASKISQYKKEVEKAKLTIKELKDVAGRMSLDNIDPYSILSVSDSIRLLRENAIDTIPILSDMRQVLKNNLNGDYGDSLLMKFRDIANGASDMVNKVTNRLGKIGNNIGKDFESLKKNISGRIEPIKNLIKNFGSFTSQTFKRVGVGLNKLNFDNPLSKIKIFANETNKLKKNNKDDNSKGFSGNITKSFLNGIKSVKKFALALLSVRTAFSLVSKSVSAYLSYDTQLSDSIQNCWNVLGSLFAPILERVINLFSTLVSYVNAFVQALTGINLVARANEKSLKKQNKELSNSNNQLSGLDDLNNLTTSGSSGSNNKITVDEVDTSWIDKLKEKIDSIDFSNLIDSIKNLKNSLEFFGSGVGGLAVDFYKNFLQPIASYTISKTIPDFLNATADALLKVDFTKVSNSLNDFYNSALPFTKNIFDGLEWFYENVLIPLGLWTINDVIPSFLNLLSGGLDVVNQAISDVKPLFEWLWDNFLQPVASWTGGVIVDTLNGIGNALKWIADNELAMSVIEGVAIAIALVNGSIAIYNGLAVIGMAVTTAFSAVIGFLTSPITLTVLAIGALIAIIILCVKHLDDIGKFASNVWNKIVEIWQGASGWVNEKVIQPIKDNVGNFFKNIKDKAKEGCEGIKNAFVNIPNWFKDKFTQAWTNVKNVFSKGGKVYDGIKEGIFNSFKNVVNTLTGGINKLISVPFNAINKALTTVRDISFLGISPFKGLIKTFNIPSIPSLATGDVLYDEQIVRVAEYSNSRSNPEIISPRDIMTDTFEKTLNNWQGNNQSYSRLIVNVMNRNFFDEAIDYINEKSERNGVSVIKEVD